MKAKKYKYRIIKKSNKSYYILECKPIVKYKWQEIFTQWSYYDLHEDLEYLTGKAQRLIKDENEDNQTIVIVKEFL